MARRLSRSTVASHIRGDTQMFDVATFWDAWEGEVRAPRKAGKAGNMDRTPYILYGHADEILTWLVC